MNTLPGTIEIVGTGIIASSYFSVGHILPTDNKKQLFTELRNMIDNVKVDLIHYDFNIEFAEEEPNLLPISIPNKNNKIPIYTYEVEDGFVGECYFGNSIFIASGSIAEAERVLLESIKEQVKVAYTYLKDNDYEWVEE